MNKTGLITLKYAVNTESVKNTKQETRNHQIKEQAEDKWNGKR